MARRPFTLSARWSKNRRRHGTSTLNGEPGDILYEWGEGVASGDWHLLHGAFGVRHSTPTPEGPRFDPSLLEELQARGYDLTTLRFSIRKRRP